MIFQYSWQAVLAKKKTQTRRIIAAQDSAVYTQDKHNWIEAVVANGRVKWKVGQTYAVQKGRAKPEIARIRITRIRSEPVSEISSADAKAEGWNSKQEFFDGWQQIHGKNSLHHQVWALDFELVEPS
jgi:hypothetical protein